MDSGLPTRITNLGIDPGLAEALMALEVARNHLNQAEGPDMVDAACYEVSAAELRLSAAIRWAKTENSACKCFQGKSLQK